jgi:hypothetical protein
MFSDPDRSGHAHMKAVETFDMLPRECVVLLLQNALQRPQDAHVVERCMRRLGNLYVCKAKPRNLNPKPDALVIQSYMRRLGNMYVCQAKPRDLNPKPDALVVERCMRRLGNMTYIKAR